MSPRFKKVIAREFLFLLSTALLFLLSLFIIYYMEEVNRKSIDKVEEKIEAVTMYENLPYRLKVFYYLKKELGSYVFVMDLGTREEVIKNLNDIKTGAKVYEFIYGWGTINIPEKEFLEKIKLDEESENYINQNIQPLEEELNQLQYSTWNWRNNDKEVGVFFIIVSILFILRYIFYATSWSIKQIRQPISS